MKQIIYKLLFAILLIGAFTSCQSDDTISGDASPEISSSMFVKESASLADIAQSGAVSSFTVTINGPWSLHFPSGSEKWMSLLQDNEPLNLSEAVSGNGEMSFEIQFMPNNSRTARTAQVLISAPLGESTLTINQASAIYNELLYLSMGEGAMTNDKLPLDGTGYSAPFAIEGSGKFESIEENVSQSIAGVYSASAGNYLLLEPANSFQMNDLETKGEDIIINFGLVESEASTFKVQYSGLSGTMEIDDFTLTKSENGASWAYYSGNISKNNLDPYSNRINIEILAGEAAIRVDDISILSVAQNKPIATISVSDIRNNQITLEGSCINIDGTEVEQNEIKNRAFRYALKPLAEGEPIWLDAPADETFKTSISKLASESEYFLQSIVTLQDDTKLFSVIIERTTSSNPTIAINEELSFGASTQSFTVGVEAWTILDDKKVPLSISSIAKFGVKYRKSNVGEYLLSTSQDSSKLSIKENELLSFTFDVSSLDAGTDYEVLGYIELDNGEILESPTPFEITTSVEEFTIGEITSTGGLRASSANEDGITFNIPVASDAAATSWLKLKTDSEYLTTSLDIVDGEDPSYPKVVRIKVSGVIAALPPSGVVVCTLTKMDEQNKPLDLRVAVSNVDGSIILLNTDFDAFGKVEGDTFNSVSDENCGLSIKRNSASALLNTEEGLEYDISDLIAGAVKAKFYISLVDDAYKITSKQNPEENVIFSLKAPYGIDLHQYNAAISSRIRGAAVNGSDAYWTFKLNADYGNNNSAWIDPDKNLRLTTAANLLYAPKFDMANAGRSDNTTLAFRFSPDDENLAATMSQAIAIHEFNVELTPKTTPSPELSISLTAELDKSSPSSAIVLTGVVENGENIEDYGFIVNGTEYWGITPSGNTFTKTIDGLSEQTTYECWAVVKLTSGEVKANLLPQSITTAEYVKPSVPTALIDVAKSAAMSSVIKLSVNFENVAKRNLTPVIEYKKVGETAYTQFLEQNLLEADASVEYEIGNLETSTSYEVRVYLKTIDGASYDAVSEIFETKAKPSVTLGAITTTDTTATIVLNFENVEEIEGFVPKYRTNTNGTLGSVIRMTKINDPSSPYTLTITDLSAGTKYNFNMAIDPLFGDNFDSPWIVEAFETK